MLDLESKRNCTILSENKGADQLRSYYEADLRLCFRHCRLPVFPCGGSYMTSDPTYRLLDPRYD